MVCGFELGRGYVVDGRLLPDGVEPLDLRQPCELDGIDGLPWSETANQLGLAKMERAIVGTSASSSRSSRRDPR
jgi:hypothetical protein